jgi:hypothetical protein
MGWEASARYEEKRWTYLFSIAPDSQAVIPCASGTATGTSGTSAISVLGTLVFGMSALILPPNMTASLNSRKM